MIADAVTWFIGLGSVVFIPIIIIILGLIVRVKPSKAIIAGITVGIGFIGLNIVTGFLQEVLGPAIINTNVTGIFSSLFAIFLKYTGSFNETNSICDCYVCPSRTSRNIDKINGNV